MNNSISSRIAEKMKKSASSSRKKYLFTFLSLKDEISEALNDGWSVKDVWALLSEEKKIVVSYQVFLRLVKQHTDYVSAKRKKSFEQKKEYFNKTFKPDHVTGSHKSVRESVQNNVKNSQSDKEIDYSKEKGFDWDTEYDPKDLI